MSIALYKIKRWLWIQQRAYRAHISHCGWNTAKELLISNFPSDFNVYILNLAQAFVKTCTLHISVLKQSSRKTIHWVYITVWKLRRRWVFPIRMLRRFSILVLFTECIEKRLSLLKLQKSRDRNASLGIISLVKATAFTIGKNDMTVFLLH